MLKINTPDTYMYDHPHSWPGTDTSVKKKWRAAIIWLLTIVVGKLQYFPSTDFK